MAMEMLVLTIFLNYVSVGACFINTFQVYKKIGKN